MPVVIVMLLIIVSGLSHFIFGYHYTPRVAKNFSNDISIIKDNLDAGDVLLVDQNTNYYQFYKLLENYNSITVMSEIPERNDDVKIASLGSSRADENLELQQIITSPKSRNSDRLYIYSKVTEKREKENK